MGISGAFATHELFGSWSVVKNLLALPLTTPVDVLVLLVVLMYWRAVRASDARPNPSPPPHNPSTALS